MVVRYMMEGDPEFTAICEERVAYRDALGEILDAQEDLDMHLQTGDSDGLHDYILALDRAYNRARRLLGRDCPSSSATNPAARGTE